MSQPTYGIAIIASDKTEKGAASAEKRLGKIPKRISDVNRASMSATERSVGRTGRSILRTFAETEKAGSRLFGNRSVMASAVSRMGAVGQAAGAMGEGVAAAAESGGMLSTVLGGLGAVAAGTIGVLAAAAYGAFKLADGWARGAASIGRTAEIIGVASKSLQEFNAAAERQGVDKDKATGALGGLSQTLNDARYGRNAQALAILNRLGIPLDLNADGTVNVEKMLPKIATGIQGQNSSGRRTIARILGIPLDALPAFSQGGAALSADMKDADKSAAVISDADIEKGKRITRKSAMVGQLKDRAMMVAGEAVSDAAEPGYDAIIKGGRWIAGAADKFDGGARTIDRAAGKIDRAADRMSRAGGGGGVVGGVLGLSERDVGDLKKLVATEWDRKSLEQGEGIIDVVLNRVASGKWGRTVASVANARKQFSDINGPVAWAAGRHSIDDVPMSRVDDKVSRLVDMYLAQRAGGAGSIVGGALNYANPYSSDARNRGWINRLDGPTFGRGRSVHKYGTVPELKDDEPGAFRVGLPNAQPLKVEIEFRNAPPGTSATVKSGSGAAGATSYAFEPVRGG